MVAGATHLIVQMRDPWNYAAVERLVRWREKQNA